MALSGTFYTSVGGGGWRLQLEWSATQDIANNRSTITAKLYWISLGSHYTVGSSATKDGGITIDGTTNTFSGTGLASLSGNQKKLLSTFTKTVTHDSDGTKSIQLSAYFDAEVSLNGTYYSRISVSGTATLNTIPSESTLTSSASWTAGNALPISISRKSTSFTHKLYIYVNNNLIKTVSNIGTSTTVTFSTTENTNIFTQLGQSSSKSTKIVLETYDANGNKIGGGKVYTGTCTAPNASIISAPSSFNIGSSFSVTITRYNSLFTHTIKLKNGSNVAKTYTNQGISTTFDTSDVSSTLYNWTPNSNSINLTLECTTYYNGVQVRTPTTKTITANVTNSNPIFGTGYTYKDTNPTTIAITGNDQYIIQNKSTVVVEIPASAGAKAVNGASMVEYTATLNGVSITKPYSSSSTVTFNFGTVNASSNLTLSVIARDSRGNTTTTTKTITIIPYSNPASNTSANRINKFDNNTIIKLSGSFSLLNIGGINKNSIQSMQYRYKESTSDTWGSWINFSYTTNSGTYTATDVVLDLDNTKSYNIEVKVQDKLATTTVLLTVPTGQPIFFIDSSKKSLGFNGFPTNPNEFKINGKIVFGANQWAINGGGINLNNSDIVNANGIYFADVADNNDEGLLFLKNGATAGSTNASDYHNLRIDGNGRLLINGENALTLSYLIVDNGRDTTGTSSNVGIMVGSLTGNNIKIDGNEVSAYNNSNPSPLHLNPDGGEIIINGSIGYNGNGGLNVYNGIKIYGNGSNTLKIYGNDHAYMEFYAKGYSGSRSGWLGYPNPTVTELTMTNSLGEVHINPYDANFKFKAMGSNDGIQGAGKAHLKWLSSSDTIQVRNASDTAYGTMQAIISNASDRRLKRNIQKIEDCFLDYVKKTPVYSYNMQGHDDDERFIGLITDEAPQEIVIPASDEDQYEGINLYAMTSFLWKAVQELSEQVDYLKEKVKR